MTTAFDPVEFVRGVGVEIVQSFENARRATTPGLKGNAMEQPIRNKLQQLLPESIGVGSGCVISVLDGTSRQMDVVLYEKDLCPVFCVNDTPEATYYPVEGVLAVGEIKSILGKKELSDSFEKIRSAKALRRTFKIYNNSNPELGISARRYGEVGESVHHLFQPELSNKGDVFGFVLAGEAGKAETVLGHYVENVMSIGDDSLCPDAVAVLNNTMLRPCVFPLESKIELYAPVRKKKVLPHEIIAYEEESIFGALIEALWDKYKNGLTAHIPLTAYLRRLSVGDNPKTVSRVGSATCWPKLLDGAGGRTPTDHISHSTTPVTTATEGPPRG